jgi:hypothetical protein
VFFEAAETLPQAPDAGRKTSPAKSQAHRVNPLSEYGKLFEKFLP